VAPPWEIQKPKRRMPGGLTSNALVSGVVAAIVAGAISFGVAHYQDQDAASQALSAEQASAVVQLQAAANSFYLAANGVWNMCIGITRGSCLHKVIADAAWQSATTELAADRTDISDPAAARLAARLSSLGNGVIEYAVGNGTGPAETEDIDLSEMGDTLGQLITRCGQLIQGQAAG